MSASIDRPNQDSLPNLMTRLIVKLEGLAESKVKARQRVDLLSVVDAQVMQTISLLPRSVGAARQAEDAEVEFGYLEQRLYNQLGRNFKLALVDIDKTGIRFANTASPDRGWLVKRLFQVFGDQIERSVRTNQSWTPGVWAELHDLFFYLTNRGGARTVVENRRVDWVFDPEVDYKRLLLLGLVQQLVSFQERSVTLFRILPSWAQQSCLRNMVAYDGVFDVYVVEISQDKPPRKSTNAINAGSIGWVLEPAQAFVDYVDGLPTNVFKKYLSDPP